MTISNGLKNALSALDVQIEHAERYLRKQPGAEYATVEIDDEMATWLGYPRNRDLVLGVCGSASEPRLGVYELGSTRTKYLTDFAVAARIELCRMIPNLLDDVSRHEPKLEEIANEVAAEIEERLAWHTQKK